jgi:hypothetical protein
VTRAATIATAIYFATIVYAAAALVPASSGHYESSQYEFSVEVPKGLLACVSDATDHGIDILLARDLRCEDDYEYQPYVDVSANYNVATDAVTPKMLARLYCRHEKAERTVWLAEWTLGGRPTEGCRQYFKDGRITVQIVTQRKTEPRDSERWIDVSASMTTTISRYERDMRVFRQIVRTVRIAPDGPLK